MVDNITGHTIRENFAGSCSKNFSFAKKKKNNSETNLCYSLWHMTLKKLLENITSIIFLLSPPYSLLQTEKCFKQKCTPDYKHQSYLISCVTTAKNQQKKII